MEASERRNSLPEGDYALLEDLALAHIGEQGDFFRNLVLSRLGEAPEAAALGMACQCFYIARCLHCLPDQPTPAILAGDYFFGRLFEILEQLGDTRLSLAFSEYLKKNSLAAAGENTEFNREEFTEFVESICRRE